MAVVVLGMSSQPVTMNETASDLPLPTGYLPFEEFAQKFSLGSASTEQIHEKTKTLSQTMQQDVVKGLEMLFDVDQAVLEGFERFIPMIQSLAPHFGECMKAGGCVYLVGSGSSGRVAIDLAAKCNLISGKIRGIIAGGDSAMVRAKEGFEDSEADGEKCLTSFHLKPEDIVILISASGSASFNVGCGHFAANKGSEVFYFYNSKEIPSRTKQLFNRINNPVRALELDIGPQAISGSTRLQGASLAEICLGALLRSALFYEEEKTEEAEKFSKDLLLKMREGNQLIAKELETIGEFVKKEAAIFLSPNANFRRLRDETTQGYVTMIGEKNTLREILIDATETSPTFSMNPIRRESDILPKRGEFRAYLVGEKDKEAWKALVGRDVETEALKDTAQFLLAAQVDGNHSYEKRPTGPGNFVIGVVKKGKKSEGVNEVLDLLHFVSTQGGDAGLISFSKNKTLSLNAKILTLLLDPPLDSFGLVETLLLKQILNLISNGSMVITGKVHGNQMIDVRASNQKLIDRILRLIKDIGGSTSLSDKQLYFYIAHVIELKKFYTTSGTYTPSVVKIVLSLIYLEKKPTSEHFQEAVDFLAEREERLDFLENAKT